jgi:hypothetical protein
MDIRVSEARLLKAFLSRVILSSAMVSFIVWMLYIYPFRFGSASS